MNIADMIQYNLIMAQLFWISILFVIVFVYMHYVFVPNAERNIGNRTRLSISMQDEIHSLQQQIAEIELMYVNKQEILDQYICEEKTEIYNRLSSANENNKSEINVQIVNMQHAMAKEYNLEKERLIALLQLQIDHIVGLYANAYIMK